jgi:hypothetical protein
MSAGSMSKSTHDESITTIVGTIVALMLIAVGGTAHAQNVGYALILICSNGGSDEPEVRLSQSSASLEQLCQHPNEDDFFLCQTIAMIEGGMPCATALSELDRAGTADAVSHHKDYLPSNFRLETGDLPNGDPVRPFERQLDAAFVLKSDSNEASIVSCDFSSSVPRLAGLQSSALDGNVPPNESSCVDGLQSRFDSGESVVDALDVHGWNPIDKEALIGMTDSSSTSLQSEAATDFAVRDPHRIIYLYTVAGPSRPSVESGAADFASMLVCDRNGETDAGVAAEPVVAYFERTPEELASCESGSAPDFCAAVAEIEAGMPCAKALAALYRSEPESILMESTQAGRPLLIVAEDIDGEPLSARVPVRPQTDIVFSLGEDESTLMGCDVLSRPGATVATFEQTPDGDGETSSVMEEAEGDGSCTQKLTLFLNDGIPLRSSSSVSPGANHAVPDHGFDPEIGIQVVRRFAPPYYVMTVTHRF